MKEASDAADPGSGAVPVRSRSGYQIRAADGLHRHTGLGGVTAQVVDEQGNQLIL